MDEEQEFLQYNARTNALATIRDKVYIHRMPSYGNKIFYSLGFLALTCLTLLVVTGVIEAFMGQAWWTANPLGTYARSVHLWTAQAFFVILILHILVVFLTSGFKAPRRMVWVFGASIFCLALITTEFGYGLRGDFGSQYRAVSGADFWNGAYLGYWLNPLSIFQTYALHIAIIPITIFLLFIAHYLLERTYGVAKPYRSDIKTKMVAADHRILFIRGGALLVLIVMLAYFFPSPYVPSVTITEAAHTDPVLAASTVLQEFEHTSDTATYEDSIQPYTFDTRKVFVVVPYMQVIGEGINQWAVFRNEPENVQQSYILEAETYVSNANTVSYASTSNPLILMLNTLGPAMQSGLYETIISQENPIANDTYSLRFLSDMGVLESKSEEIGMNTANWGMARDVTGHMFMPTPGSWWFAPIGMANSTFNLLESDTGDRDAAAMMGFVMLMFILFPYIPYVNRIPELLHVAPFIWKERR